MVSWLRSIRLFTTVHSVSTLVGWGVFLPILFVVFHPKQVSGSNPVEPTPVYSALTPVLSDSTSLPGAKFPEQMNGKGIVKPSFPFGGHDSSRTDTTAAHTRPVDSTYVVYLDSTSRLKQFTPRRREQPQVDFFPDRVYPLFATPRVSSYQRLVNLDSAGQEYRFRETVAGEDSKIPLSLSFHDYVLRRRKMEMRKALADEARKPKAFVERNDLGELMSTITKISIPVPANPLFSIFGKNEINLNISGAVDIKAGFRNTKSDQTQVSVLDQSRNEPDFQQEVQVNVNGMIGDKLSILADWNTQRTFEYENQLKIKYTGYDDEIVQSVEAGNVSLTTPSQFIGSSQALFGLKAKLQTGPLTLTTLASQKKGQIKEVSVSGGSQEIPFGPGGQGIKPYDYSTNYYFVDTDYRALYEPYYNTEPPTVNPSMKIVDQEVWVQRGPVNDPNERPGVAQIDLAPRPQGGYPDEVRGRLDSSGVVESQQFIRLDPSQYELVGDGYLGVIALNSSVQDIYVIAIAYRRADGTQFGEFSRDLDTTGNRRLVLKMLKPKNLLSSPQYKVAWNQLLKNIYPLSSRNIKQQGFALDILRTIPGQQEENSILNQRLLRVFGVDNYNSDATAAPEGDNAFDFRPGRTINQARGEVIFPSLRPFDDGIKKYFQSKFLPLPDSSYFFPEIYDTTKTFAQQNLEHDRYIIKGKATGESASKFNLGFNIVEGSVQVLLDGRKLTPNVDYTVDYIVGEVVIRNDRALVPGANLQIKYEQNDLFQLASKTLLGARGDLAISQNTNLGFTIMNLNQQTLSDKVRLGEEPNKNTILGFDGQTQFNLPFLTSAINALPLLETRELSNIRFAGEAAYMMPDPNTKKSTIPSDQSGSIAYVDDFEGARRTIPFGVNYGQWSQASPPADTIAAQTISDKDTLKMFSKGRLTWFTRQPTDVLLTDIYPNKKPGNDANNRTNVLDVYYSPLTRGMYNLSPHLDSTLTPRKNWGGIMKPISIAATNLINENMTYIEIWMQIDKAPRNQDGSIPKMRIDMGTISEDVIPDAHKTRDGHLNSEDLVVSSSPNGTLQEGEDVGLDMMNDAEERAYVIEKYGSLDGFDPNDPSGDDYAFNNGQQVNPQDFSHLSGTEKSLDSPLGRIPDTEDLNSNGQCDRLNQYMEYEVSLDTNRATNPLIVGGGFNDKKWYQFRIPIRDYTRLVGAAVPNFENVESVRLSFLNTENDIWVRIADMSLVGNQWQVPDTNNFAVSVVSVEDNPNYTSPPGVVRERDKTQPDQEVLANEQSLALLLNGIPSAQSRRAVKFYTYRPLDVFSYRRMKMFVHGDNSFNDVPVRPQSFFQFGLDSLNYYEYRGPIYPGWDSRNEIIVEFSELTAIKQLRDSNETVTKVIRYEGGDSIMYRVVGNPSLTQVRYLAVGVANRADQGPLYGQVWYNELRLVEADDSPGWAYRFETQLKLADFGTVSFNYSKVDPNFHTLEQRFGSRQTGINWALNASVSLEKFFPNDWVGTSLPFSYSRSVSLIRPKYLPNSDILVDEAATLTHDKLLVQGSTETDASAAADEVKLQSETYRITDTYAAPNFRFGLPSQAWYVRDTFNKLAFGFSYTKSRERSPATVSHTAWSWNARIGYSLSLSPDYYIQPFTSLFDGVWFLNEYKDVKFFFTPTNFTWSLSADRRRDNSLQRVRNAPETISRQFTTSRQFGFGWKLSEGGLTNLSGTYNLTADASLLDLETDRFGRQRSFSKILDDIFFGDKVLNFGNDTRYSQQNQFTSRPNIPNIFNIKKYFDLSLSYGVDYGWQNTLTNGNLGKSAGWNNNINVTMNFKLKQLFDPLFEDSGPVAAQAPEMNPRGRGRGARESEEEPKSDESLKGTQPADSGAVKPVTPNKTMAQLKNLVKFFIKIPFLDYDNINVTFTQTNNVTNNGIVGRTGFVNFWGRVPFFQDADIRYGPSRLYQLGLVSDPNGRLGKFGIRSSFPFFGWGETEPGLRTPGLTLVNTFRQQNRLALKTSRDLWQGARIDLNWSVGWAYSKTQNFTTDSLGVPQFANIATASASTAGSVERSYLTFPDVLFLGMFKSSLKDVSKRYGELKHDGDSTRSNDEKIAQAFEEGFEALPILRKVFGQYFPRVNWNLRWDGLEKLPLFSGFASRVSLEHGYTSTYNRQFENRPGSGGERTSGQRIAYGFAPLVGVNFTFKELLKGSFGANLRYNSNTSFDLATSSQNIVEQLTQEISITANYSRRGFEIPFFGLTLNNDLDVSASYSLSKNSRVTYDITKLDVNTTGTPLEGSTRTVLEPRIKYILSSRVTASVYYRYTKIAPDDSGSRIPGSTINAAGLDIHIAIQ